MAGSARADVTLAPLFQDHAILQRDRPLPVWGRAAPGEHVAVAFHGQTVGTTAGADGRWMLYLAPVPVSAEPSELVVSGTNVVTVKDVLVGEVWLASGQSNMEWPLWKAADGDAEVARANFPALRLFSVLHAVASQPAETATGSWQPCTPESARPFSAVAYYFGRDLLRKLGVPVGVIGTYWGGTPVESWTAGATLRGTKAWPEIDARWQKILPTAAEYAVRYPAERAAWGRADGTRHAVSAQRPV